jgi:peptide/nickel transport system substrate-binding protein
MEHAEARIPRVSPCLEPSKGAVAMALIPRHQRRRTFGPYGPRRLLAAGAGLVALALAAAGCSSSSSSPSSAATTPVSGGTATWAELPSDIPNYIFPFTSSEFISVSNLEDFGWMLYRPLYWFGTGAAPTLNSSLSLANYPTFSGNKVTVTLKHYVWSNGQPVTAQNVMFWLNMLTAVGSVDWGAYTGFPNTVVSNIKVVSPTELTMTMDKAYSHYWFVYNELSQITPMPEAWDRTASGPSHCSTTVSDCAAVYKYLDSQSKDLGTYATSPLWGVVDGPFKLTAFNADGHLTMVPNKSYSGPVKPKLSEFKEVPFTTDAAEYDVLRAPGSSLTVGYIPTEDLPAKPLNAAVGSNPVPGYYLAPQITWGVSYYTLNQQSTISDHAAIFKQLYFRQALAYLMDQPADLAGPLKGYGVTQNGPVGSYPATSWLSPQGKKGVTFPYDPAKAKTLLTSHGWSVAPSGTTTCAKPGTAAGDCGAGITTGSTLSFTFAYATGLSWVQSELEQLQSSAASVGIKLNLKPEPFDNVVSANAGNCVVAKIPCNWDMADWGLGWSFAPDYYPTGETLFLCGAIANSSGYCNPANDAMIDKTLTNTNLSYMYSWQDYLATQLPVEWQVNAPYLVAEIANNLKGVTPMSTTLTLNPENWYFVK